MAAPHGRVPVGNGPMTRGKVESMPPQVLAQMLAALANRPVPKSQTVDEAGQARSCVGVTIDGDRHVLLPIVPMQQTYTQTGAGHATCAARAER